MKKLSLTVDSLAVQSFQTGAAAQALAATRPVECPCASCGGGRCLPPYTSIESCNLLEC